MRIGCERGCEEIAGGERRTRTDVFEGEDVCVFGGGRYGLGVGIVFWGLE